MIYPHMLRIVSYWLPTAVDAKFIISFRNVAHRFLTR